MLRLVQDHVAKVERLQQLLVAAKQRVAGDHHVGLFELGRALTAIRPLPHHCLEPWRELGDLAFPVRHDRGRRDHEVELALVLALRPEEQRDRLNRLTEAHVVGEDAAAVELMQKDEPREAVFLVGTQIGLEGSRLGDARDLVDVFDLCEQRLGGRRHLGVLDHLQEVLHAPRLRERKLVLHTGGRVDLGHPREHVAHLVGIDRRVGSVFELNQPPPMLEASPKLLFAHDRAARFELHVEVEPIDSARHAHLRRHRFVADGDIHQVVRNETVPVFGKLADPVRPERDRVVAGSHELFAGLRHLEILVEQRLNAGHLRADVTPHDPRPPLATSSEAGTPTARGNRPAERRTPDLRSARKAERAHR